MSKTKRIKVHFLGGRQHWNINELPLGHKEGYCDVVYRYPREFKIGTKEEMLSEMPLDLELDEERYRPQIVSVSAITNNWNRVYKDVYIYMLAGYKPQGYDFSIMMTALLQQPWKIWPNGSRWFWELTAKQREAALAEQTVSKCIEDYPFEIQACEHGPGYSEEFENSFDNMIS
jgi:hypothetical protein